MLKLFELRQPLAVMVLSMSALWLPSAQAVDECGTVPPTTLTCAPGNYANGITYNAVANGLTLNVGNAAATSVTTRGILLQGNGDLVLNAGGFTDLNATAAGNAGGILVSNTTDTGSATANLSGADVRANGSGAEGVFARVTGSAINAGAVRLSIVNSNVVSALDDAAQLSHSGLGAGTIEIIGSTLRSDSGGNRAGIDARLLNASNTSALDVLLRDSSVTGSNGVLLSTNNAGGSYSLAIINSTITANTGRGINLTGRSGGTITLDATSLLDASASGNAIRSNRNKQDVVSNAGTILGSVLLGSGADSFTNSGTLNGNLNMGGGNDTVAIAGGTVTGNVALGGGADSLTISNTAALVGNVNSGGGSDALTNSGSITGNVNMGNGSDTVELAGGTINGNLVLGGGSDQVDILAGGQQLGGINLGGGNNRLTSAGLIDTAGTNIVAGNGRDTVQLLAGSTTNVGAISLAGGNDTFDLNGGVLSGNVNMGGGRDTANLSGGEAGVISTGGSVDTINWRAVTAVDSVDAGSGNDTVTFFADANLAAAAGLVDGGSGNDVALFDGAMGTLNELAGWETVTIQNGADVTVGSVSAGVINTLSVVDSAAVISNATVNNSFSVNNSAVVVTGSTVNTDIVGSANQESITLGGGTVVSGDISAAAGNDTVLLAGADVSGTILGGDDADTITVQAGSVNGVDAGAGNDSLSYVGGTVNGVIQGGLGSDTLTVSGTADLSTVSLLDGGDDASSGDGQIDTITFAGSSYSISSSLLANWEQVVVEGGTLSFTDNALTVSDEPGQGLFVRSGGVFDAGDTFALTGNLTVESAAFFLGIGAGISNYSVSGSVTNNGSISLQDGVVGDSFAIGGDYAGGGVLAGDVNLDTLTADVFTVAGNTAGQTTLNFIDVGNDLGQDGQVLVVDVTGTSNAGSFRLGQALRSGPFQYDLEQLNGDWFLVAKLANASSLFTAAPSLSLELASQQLGTWRERNGGLDASNRPKLWVRGLAGDGEYQVDTNPKLMVGIDRQYSGYELGLSLPGVVNTKTEFRWVPGVMLGYSQTEARLQDGSGQVDAGGESLGVYSTFVKGRYYLDLVLKGQQLDTEIESGVDGIGVKYDATILTASAEVGSEFTVWSNWRLEPQVQLAYHTLDQDDFQDQNGSTVSLKSGDSVIGRAGLRLSYPQQRSSALIVPYVRADVTHEFDGGSTIRLNDNEFSAEARGTDFAGSVGVTAAYRNGWSGYLQAKYRDGDISNGTWEGRVGIMRGFGGSRSASGPRYTLQ